VYNLMTPLYESIVDAQPALGFGKENYLSGPDKQRMLAQMDKALKHLPQFLAQAEANPFLNKKKLQAKLDRLNEMNRVRLYLAVKRFVWADADSSNTPAQDLREAGFFGANKEGLKIARALERFEARKADHARRKH
jgi:hypothetical protein